MGDHERVDYISNLPDTILCEILSYLPIKAAVKTSILSTKWKYIWTQVPALDFTDILPRPGYVMPRNQQIICMANAVERVLLVNNASHLERFCLHFPLHRVPNNIKSWLDAVKWREICEVNMKFYREELVPLPRQFLCGSKLVALNLDGFCIDDDMPLSTFHLPNLETVHFGERIAFPGDKFLQRFLLGCPVLKELFIHSTIGFDENVCIESLTLKSLDIRNTGRRSGSLCISITAPNLCYLCLCGEQALYKFGDLNMLTEAVLDLGCAYNCPWDIDHNTSQLMKKLSGVRTLWFGIIYDLRKCRLPIFKNLTHLKLRNNDRCNTELLKYTPNLKSLILKHVGHNAPRFDPEAVHECMSCLERVEFFLKEYSVLDFVEQFFKAATALKEMTINERGLVGTGRLVTVRQRLRSLPMASPICRLKFVD